MRRGPEADVRPAERHGEDEQRARLNDLEDGNLQNIWKHVSNLSKCTGDGNTGRAYRWEQAANGTHHRGKNEPTGHQGRCDSELERDLGEAGEVRGAGGEAVHWQREDATEHTADDGERDRFGQKRRDDPEL